MLKLQFKDQRKAAIWLVDSRYAIGRDKSNDIILDEDGVSGFHAELRVEGDDRIFLTDAGSIGGTFVNGKQIRARTQLRANDVIRINRAELLLVDPKEQLKAQGGEELATAMTPALQGLAPAATGSGGVPTGWLLRARTGSITGEGFPIPATGRAILGRAQSCDIVLPGNHVSRQHAELYFQSGRLRVRDLGSSNGTFVNRKKVRDAVVNPGDELRFDTLVFQVEAPGQPPGTDTGREAEADRTLFRPAVNAPAGGSAAPPRPADQAPAAPAPTRPARPAPGPSPAPAAAAPAGKPSSVGWVLLLTGVAGVGVLAWLFR